MYKYRIFRSTSETGTYELVYEVMTNYLEWTNDGLVANTTYWYKMCAVDTYTNMESDYTTPVSITPTFAMAPTVPQNLTCTDSTNGCVELEWDASTAGDNAIRDYIIFRNSEEIEGDYIKLGYSYGTETSYIDMAVSSASSYTYWVAAEDDKLNQSDMSNHVDVTVSGDYFLAPTGYTLENGAKAVRLKWDDYAIAGTQTIVDETSSSGAIVPYSGSAALAGYRIYKDGTAFCDVGASTTKFVDYDTVPADYTVAAIIFGNATSAETSALTSAPETATATITYPVTPALITGSLVNITGTCNYGWSLKNVRLNITGTTTEYAYASVGDEQTTWELPILFDKLEHVHVTAAAVADDETIGSESAVTEITIEDSSTIIYKVEGNVKTVVTQPMNITVTGMLNASWTAEFDLPTRQLNFKDLIEINQNNVSFAGRIRARTYTETGVWHYECVDYTYDLLSIRVSELSKTSKTWMNKLKVNDILTELFKTAKDKYGIKLGLYPHSSYTGSFYIPSIGESNLQEALEYFCELTGDKWFYNAKLGYIDYFTPSVGRTAESAITYGDNISSFTFEENRDNLCNIVKVNFTLPGIPDTKDGATEENCMNQIYGRRITTDLPLRLFDPVYGGPDEGEGGYVPPNQNTVAEVRAGGIVPIYTWNVNNIYNVYVEVKRKAGCEYDLGVRVMSAVLTRADINHVTLLALNALPIWDGKKDIEEYQLGAHSGGSGSKVFPWEDISTTEWTTLAVPFTLNNVVKQSQGLMGYIGVELFVPVWSGDSTVFQGYYFHAITRPKVTSTVPYMNRWDMSLPLDPPVTTTSCGWEMAWYAQCPTRGKEWTFWNFSDYNLCSSANGAPAPPDSGSFNAISLHGAGTYISKNVNISNEDYAGIKFACRGDVLLYIDGSPAAAGVYEPSSAFYKEYNSTLGECGYVILSPISNITIKSGGPNCLIDLFTVMMYTNAKKITKTINEVTGHSGDTSIADYGISFKEFTKKFTSSIECRAWIDKYLTVYSQPAMAITMLCTDIIKQSDLSKYITIDLPEVEYTKEIVQCKWDLLRGTTQVTINTNITDMMVQKVKELM